jgi:hypothetical protein
MYNFKRMFRSCSSCASGGFVGGFVGGNGYVRDKVAKVCVMRCMPMTNADMCILHIGGINRYAPILQCPTLNML